MKKKIILVASLFGLGLMLIQSLLRAASAVNLNHITNGTGSVKTRRSLQQNLKRRKHYE
ncbi:MAG: hypothetical protein HY314_12705 [Acidobacteria bacterium]|nr:hypothetical protein [Acidobacteriota bacterium]